MSPSTWTAVLVIAALVVLIWVWRWLAGPSPIALSSPAKRKDAFRLTLMNGAKGARLRLQVARDPLVRIDLLKYIKRHDDVGLRIALERTARNAELFRDCRLAFEHRGLNFVSVLDARGRERMELDIGTDLDVAEAVAKCVFEEVLGLDLARDVVGYYDLVLITNVPRLTGVGDL